MPSWRASARARCSRRTTSPSSRAIPDGVVDLAYADPPFATGRRRRLVSIRTGHRGRGRGPGSAAGRRARRPSATSPTTTTCRSTQHLAALGARVREIRRVLAPARIAVPALDWRTVAPRPAAARRGVRAERFLNEIVWAYDYGGRARDRWPRKHDTILWYAKGEHWLFDRDAIDRIPYLAPGLVGPEKAARGKLPNGRVVDDDRAAGVRGADRVSHPEARPAAGADRRGVEPAGRPRARSVRRLRDDGRRGGAAGAAVAAGGPQPRGGGDRAGPARGAGPRARPRDP